MVNEVLEALVESADIIAVELLGPPEPDTHQLNFRVG